MLWIVWTVFILGILALLAIDLGVLNKKSHVPSTKEALRWTAFCVALALLFNVAIYFLYTYQVAGLGISPALSGREAALQFLSGWLVEQTLSLDNIFVIAVIFTYFKIPQQYQHRVLFWGILGALVMRGIVIALGAALIAAFSWTHYVFGALLLYAAFKLMNMKEDEYDPSESIIYKLARRFLPFQESLSGQKFLVRDAKGRWALTPLLLVLLLVESTDLLFAVDSIPAVFAITKDPFIVFTSNIFAILSLRSLYFALSALMGRFKRLKTGLLIILAFVGIKMLLSHHVDIPTELTASVILASLAWGIIAK